MERRFAYYASETTKYLHMYVYHDFCKSISWAHVPSYWTYSTYIQRHHFNYNVVTLLTRYIGRLVEIRLKKGMSFL